MGTIDILGCNHKYGLNQRNLNLQLHHLSFNLHFSLYNSIDHCLCVADRRPIAISKSLVLVRTYIFLDETSVTTNFHAIYPGFSSSILCSRSSPADAAEQVTHAPHDFSNSHTLCLRSPLGRRKSCIPEVSILITRHNQ